MAEDVVVTVGTDTSAVTKGLADLRNQVSRTMGQMRSEMAQAVSVGGITAAFTSILQQVRDIHRESVRFGLDAQQFQILSNAAKEFGLSGEVVARGMNRLTISVQEAITKAGPMRSALHELNIDEKSLIGLNPQEVFYKLSDALKVAGLNGDTFTAIAKLMSARFGTELIPMMLQGSAAIDEAGQSMSRFSDITIDRIEQARRTLESLRATLTTQLAEWMGAIIARWQAMWMAIGAGIDVVVIKSIGGFKALVEAAKLHLPQAEKIWADAQRQAQEATDAIQKDVDALLNPPAATKPSGFKNVAADVEALNQKLGGTATAAGSAGESMDAMERKTRTNLMSIMSDQEKLNTLLKEQAAIQAQITALPKDDRLSTVDKLNALTEQLKEKNSEIAVIQHRISDEAHSQYITDLQDADAINKKVVASKEQVDLTLLQQAGATDAAEQKRLELGYDKQITDAIQKANEAYAKGDAYIGDMNTKLAQQLATEKAVAVAALQAAQVREAALSAINASIELQKMQGLIGSETAAAEQQYVDLQIKSQTLGAQINGALAVGNTALAEQLSIYKQITDQQAIQARNAAAAKQLYETGFTGSIPYSALGYFAQHGLSMGPTAPTFTAAFAAARGIQPGTPEYNRLLLQQTAQEQLRNLTGQNLSFFDQLNRDKMVQAFSATQAQQAQKAADIAHQQQVAFWGAIAQGQMPAPGNLAQLMFGIPNFATGKLTMPDAGQAQQIIQLNNIITLMQEGLMVLGGINGRLTPIPGLI